MHLWKKFNNALQIQVQTYAPTGNGMQEVYLLLRGNILMEVGGNKKDHGSIPDIIDHFKNV